MTPAAFVTIMFSIASCSANTAAHSGPSAVRSSTVLAPGELAHDSTLMQFARTLGCTHPSLENAISPVLKAAGITSFVQCSTSSRAYLLMRSTKSGQVDSYLKKQLRQVVKVPGASYVSSANWAALSRVDDPAANPLQAQAEEIQRKLGGKITTLP